MDTARNLAVAFDQKYTFYITCEGLLRVLVDEGTEKVFTLNCVGPEDQADPWAYPDDCLGFDFMKKEEAPQELLCSSTGRTLAVVTQCNVFVISLPELPYIETENTNLCCCSHICTDLEFIRQAKFHPLSAQHIVVLLSDNTLSVYNHGVGTLRRECILTPEQTFYLRLPIRKFHCAPIRVDSCTECTEESEPTVIGFDFQGSQDWSAFNVLFATTTGHIYALSPVIPFYASLPQSAIQAGVKLCQQQHFDQTHSVQLSSFQAWLEQIIAEVDEESHIVCTQSPTNGVGSYINQFCSINGPLCGPSAVVFRHPSIPPSCCDMCVLNSSLVVATYTSWHCDVWKIPEKGAYNLFYPFALTKHLRGGLTTTNNTTTSPKSKGTLSPNSSSAQHSGSSNGGRVFPVYCTLMLRHSLYLPKSVSNIIIIPDTIFPKRVYFNAIPHGITVVDFPLAGQGQDTPLVSGVVPFNNEPMCKHQQHNKLHRATGVTMVGDGNLASSYLCVLVYDDDNVDESSSMLKRIPTDTMLPGTCGVGSTQKCSTTIPKLSAQAIDPLAKVKAIQLELQKSSSSYKKVELLKLPEHLPPEEWSPDLLRHLAKNFRAKELDGVLGGLKLITDMLPKSVDNTKKLVERCDNVEEDLNKHTQTSNEIKLRLKAIKEKNAHFTKRVFVIQASQQLQAAANQHSQPNDTLNKVTAELDQVHHWIELNRAKPAILNRKLQQLTDEDDELEEVAEQTLERGGTPSTQIAQIERECTHLLQNTHRVLAPLNAL